MYFRLALVRLGSADRILKSRSGLAGSAKAECQLDVLGWFLEGILYCKLAFCFGHPDGGQPAPHPGFENQRFPGVARRQLGGPGPPFPADLGDSGGSGRN